MATMDPAMKALTRIKRDRRIYLFIIPGIIFYLLFNYWPLYGVLIAFKDFRITRGIMGRPIFSEY
jgi:putative aldouronate transport system permease protein